MTEKKQPLGICDNCLSEIPAHTGRYTSKGKPRMYCGRDCRNAANSRAGAAIRGEKTKRRIARGEWQNPADLNTPSPENIAEGVSRTRKAEVAAGTWRNPALTPDAKKKLSRPHKHGDNPVLHSALEKLRHGTVADLTDEEAQAHRDYRLALAQARREELNANARERYHQRQAALTDEEREAQRAKWRKANKRKYENTG
jgi:hypothetical protein